MTLNIANLDRLISHLEGLPEEKFDMQAFYSKNGKSSCSSEIRGKVLHSCGTAACIAGWIFEIDRAVLVDVVSGGDWLGLSNSHAYCLFEPPEFGRSAGSYPLSRAIRTLKHMRAEFLRTGQIVVDWDAPDPAARKDWAAPQAVERVLPAEITALLTTFDRVEVL